MARKNLGEAYNDWINEYIEKEVQNTIWGNNNRQTYKPTADDFTRGEDLRKKILKQTKTGKAHYQEKFLNDLVKKRQIVRIGNDKNPFVIQPGNNGEVGYISGDNGQWSNTLSFQSSTLNEDGNLESIDLSDWFGHNEGADNEIYQRNLDNFIHSDIFLEDEITYDDWKNDYKKSRNIIKENKTNGKPGEFVNNSDIKYVSEKIGMNSHQSKNFSYWYEGFLESGTSFSGNGKSHGFSQLGVYDVDENGFYKKGVFNTDHEWLVDSWAEATDDELNSYIKRLQNEGYSKKDLVRVKDTLERQRAGARTFKVDNFVKKTSAGDNMDIVDIDGKQYGILGGGQWMGDNVSMMGIDIDTGKQINVGELIFGKDTSYDEKYKRLTNFLKNKTTRSSAELLEEIKTKNRRPDSQAIEDFKKLTDEEIANFSDDDLSDWAENGDDFNRALELREQARQRLKNNAGSQQAETNVEPNNPESIPQETPQDVEETIETHSDNTDTSTVEHSNKLDTDDIVDPIEPEFRHNTVETKPQQRVKGRRNKKSVDVPKTSKGRGKAKGSTKKTFTKGRNLAKGAGQAVAGKVLGEAAEQTGKIVDDVIEEGLDNVDDVIKAAEPEFEKLPIEPEFNPDPLDTKAEVKKPQGQAKPDDNLKVDTDNPFDTTPTHGVEPVFDLGDEVDEDALKMLQEGTEGSISAIGRVANIGMNAFGAIGAYKDARRKGHGVVSSTVRAGIDFAVGELLGPIGYMAVQGAYYAGKGVIKGTEALYKENRRMNSAANQQVFGGAQFQDTQQLATMRQSGMEMAKMAQYNLQQTLMGNEATHLHR